MESTPSHMQLFAYLLSIVWLYIYSYQLVIINDPHLLAHVFERWL